jgi:hypothetical protein
MFEIQGMRWVRPNAESKRVMAVAREAVGAMRSGIVSPPYHHALINALHRSLRLSEITDQVSIASISCWNPRQLRFQRRKSFTSSQSLKLHQKHLITPKINRVSSFSLRECVAQTNIIAKPFPSPDLRWKCVLPEFPSRDF